MRRVTDSSPTSSDNSPSSSETSPSSSEKSPSSSNNSPSSSGNSPPIQTPPEKRRRRGTFTLLFLAYIAINHPDGAGGYGFIASDWGYGSLYQWDTDTHEHLTDDKGDWLTGNIGDPNLEGIVTTGSCWYGDFPNLGLGMMTDGGKN